MGSRAYILGFLTFSSYINFIFKNYIMKKSGLEWLKPQIELMLMDGYKSYPNELEEVFEIAKKMEIKSQVLNSDRTPLKCGKKIY